MKEEIVGKDIREIIRTHIKHSQMGVRFVADLIGKSSQTLNVLCMKQEKMPPIVIIAEERIDYLRQCQESKNMSRLSVAGILGVSPATLANCPKIIEHWKSNHELPDNIGASTASAKPSQAKLFALKQDYFRFAEFKHSRHQ